MLRRIGVGLFMCILGFILLFVSGVWGVVRIGDVHRYTTCEALNTTLPLNGIGSLVLISCMVLGTR